MTAHPPEEILLGFVTAIRAAGVPAGPDRTENFLRATSLVDLAEPERVRAAGRATLCGHPDDLHRHDQVFDAWFGAGHHGLPRRRDAAATAAGG